MFPPERIICLTEAPSMTNTYFLIKAAGFLAKLKQLNPRVDPHQTQRIFGA
jgi:hypothetical protein